jgi:hypothetical protein
MLNDEAVPALIRQNSHASSAWLDLPLGNLAGIAQKPAKIRLFQGIMRAVATFSPQVLGPG